MKQSQALVISSVSYLWFIICAGSFYKFLSFGFSILIGQLIFALGCSTKSIVIMLIGRTIFGFGGESINTTQFSIILQWFAPNEIAFAMGLCLSFAKIGNALNNVISPRIATVSFILFF